MSAAIAQQLALAFLGRNLDTQWASATANLLNGGQPSVALQGAFYNAAVAEGVFHVDDSPSALVNEIFQNIFGFAASSFEQVAWGNLITTGVMTKETAAWTIFKSYLGATNVPDAYKLPAQSKLVAMNAYSAQLLQDGAANLALAAGGTAATSARAYVSGVSGQASAASAIAGAQESVHALTVVVGQTFSLTPGIDTVTGTSGNDTINGVADTNTLTTLDTIDGGDGTDTLNLTSVQKIDMYNVPVTVKNVEAAVVTTADYAWLDTYRWAGLNTLTVKAAADTSNNFMIAAPTTAVTYVNNSNRDVVIDGGGGALSVTNGDGDVTNGVNTAGNHITSATITGGKFIDIRDRSGEGATIGKSLTKVSLDGQSGNANLTGDAITTVNVARTFGDVTVTAAAGTRSLTLGLNDVYGGIYTDATATAVTVVSASTTGEGGSTAGDLAFAAAKSITFSGVSGLRATTTHFDAATSLTVNSSAAVQIDGYNQTGKLTAVTVSGSGGFHSDLSTQTKLTKIDASASSGANTVYINTTQSYLGGSGVDTVIATAAPTVTVDGGAGANDVFVMDAPSFSLSKVVNFETLELGQAATGTYSVAGFSHLSAGYHNGVITLNSVTAGTDVTIYENVGLSAIEYNLASDTSADVLALTLKSALDINVGQFQATAVETVKISLVDTDTTKHIDTISLASSTLKSVVITGNAGLALTSVETTVTSVDASAVTNTAGTSASGLSWTTGALAGAAVIKGTSTGGDVINAAAATKAVTITEYAGSNTITGSSTVGSTLTGGSGNDIITGGAGKDTIIGGGGGDVITAGAGADSITLSGSSSKIVQGAGHSGSNTTTSVQVSELTGTFDIIRGVVAGDTLKVTGATALQDLTLTASNLAGRDDYASFARGTYDAGAGTFTYAANGADTALTYDTSNVTALYETVILVGFVAGSTTSIAIVGSDSVITFA